VQSAKQELEKQGAAIVVVSFAEPDRLTRYQRIHPWPFTLLADPDREAYSHFGLERLPWYRVFSLATLKLYAHLLWRGRKMESYGRDDYFQAGGDFLLDREGRLLFAYHSHDPADRPGVDRLLDELSKARNQASQSP
jgi:hypothetical protein